MTAIDATLLLFVKRALAALPEEVRDAFSLVPTLDGLRVAHRWSYVFAGLVRARLDAAVDSLRAEGLYAVIDGTGKRIEARLLRPEERWTSATWRARIESSLRRRLGRDNYERGGYRILDGGNELVIEAALPVLCDRTAAYAQAHVKRAKGQALVVDPTHYAGAGTHRVVLSIRGPERIESETQGPASGTIRRVA